MIRNAANAAVHDVLPNGRICASQTHWYVVHTKPHQEFRALEQLQNQDYDCYLPTLQVTKLCRGKSISVIEPLFSRYLFIRLDNANTNWTPIRSTRGVSSIVSFGGRFAILPDNYVSVLQGMPKSEAANQLLSREQAQITSMPLSGIGRLHQLPDGEARAFVLIELMRAKRINPDQPCSLNLAPAKHDSGVASRIDHSR